MKLFRHLICCSLLFSSLLSAQTFKVNDIRLEGLQRVSAGTVFASLPIQIGDQLDTLAIQRATRELFKTGYFADIAMQRDNGVLVIQLRERPAISDIAIDGNKAIKTEDLMKGLTDNGLSEGQIFKRATLEGLTQELRRQYVAQGRYSADVEATVIDLPRNQVKLQIDVDEGDVAAIKHINIVGNKDFDDEELRDLFELKSTGWLSWIMSDDKYAKEKLSGDLERIESHYLDRGYLQFEIDSTQVSLSPSKEAVFITVNIIEGEVYEVGKVELAGDPILPEEQMRRLLLVREGQKFSQVLMTTTAEYMTKRLGNEGYTFAEVKGIPEIDDEDGTVKITFFVDPGKRAYVRRINFRGNTTTADNVLRREMRQMEGASASSARIEQSKVQLERLGFFKEVTVENKEVPGSADLIDVEYTVEEQPSGSIGASIGYAQGSGLVLGANVQQDNWLGTGKSVGFNISRSSYQTAYSFNYTDPYFTPDGVSRGFNLFYQTRDYSRINVSSYSTDSYGASLNFGYPISNIERLGFSVGYQNLSIQTGIYAVQEIVGSPRRINGVGDVAFTEAQYQDLLDAVASVATDPTGEDDFSATFQDVSALLDAGETQAAAQGFIDGNGDNFNLFTGNINWAKSTLNRGRLASRGTSQRLSLEFSLPGGDLEYYKLIYTAQYFRPITNSFTLRLRTRLGYADSYGDTTELPFFQNFYAGGFGSVRGFKRNTLGPQSTPATNYTVRQGSEVVDNAVQNFTPYYIVGADGQLVSTQVQSGSNSSNRNNPFGGNILIEGSAEILFPLPFIKDQRTLQSAFFIDAGNVFDTSCGVGQQNCYDVDLSHLSASVGIGVTWISGFGPLTFSVAKALQENPYDEKEVFQFSLGTSF